MANMINWKKLIKLETTIYLVVFVIFGGKSLSAPGPPRVQDTPPRNLVKTTKTIEIKISKFVGDGLGTSVGVPMAPQKIDPTQHYNIFRKFGN